MGADQCKPTAHGIIPSAAHTRCCKKLVVALSKQSSSGYLRIKHADLSTAMRRMGRICLIDSDTCSGKADGSWFILITCCD